MKRLLICLFVLLGIVLAGCELDVDEDIRLSDDAQQVEVTVQQ